MQNETKGPKDMTGILLPSGQLDEDEIRRRVLEHVRSDVLVRVAPLDAVGLTQVEVHSGSDGMPCEEPELVGRLSKGGRATFVHVNHTSKQAMVHGFVDGQPQEGFAGEPGEQFEDKLKQAIGVGPWDAIMSADDGSRLGIGVASSRTSALVRGAELVLPVGTPTEFGSFQFHDRGAGLDEGERLLLFAFDARGARSLFQDTAGGQLAERIAGAPPGAFGPLDGLRVEAAARLSQLGSRTPAQAACSDVRALELCALYGARAFSGGDARSFWDERVLPLFSLADGDARIAPHEVEELDDCASVLHAMVEVLPFAAPPGGEGALLQQLGDDEIGPLAPWARPGEEYAGSMFTLRVSRLLPLVRALDGRRLNALIHKFEHAWYRAARPGMPEGDAFEAWRRARAEEGAADIDRVLRDWTELRIVLELACVNQLEVALLFYEGA